MLTSAISDSTYGGGLARLSSRCPAGSLPHRLPYLGAMYAQLFPGRVDRLVLDSAIDPNRPGVQVLRVTAPAREAALRQWATLAAAHDDLLHLGSTPEAVLALIRSVYEASAAHPLKVGRWLVDDSLTTAVLVAPLSGDSDAENLQLAQYVQVFAQAVRDGSAQPTPELDAALAGPLTGVDSAMRSAQTAIQCADAPVSRDPNWYWRDIQAHRAAEPLFGPGAGRSRRARSARPGSTRRCGSPTGCRRWSCTPTAT